MNIELIVVGKTDSKEVESLVALYARRINRYCRFAVTVLPDVRNALDAVRDLPGDDRAPVIISGSLYMLAEFYGLYPHLLEQPASAQGAKEDA